MPTEITDVSCASVLLLGMADALQHDHPHPWPIRSARQHCADLSSCAERSCDCQTDSCCGTTIRGCSFSHTPCGDCYDIGSCELYGSAGCEKGPIPMVDKTSLPRSESRRGFLRGASLGVGSAALGGLITACGVLPATSSGSTLDETTQHSM